MLSHVWGLPDFRHHQKKAILSALRGRDCLAVLPTGGGKSLCFQVPALVLGGLTLVVSPLISLMQDQVAALRKRDVAAAYLSSTQSSDTRQSVLTALERGIWRLLYVAPERLSSLIERFPRLAVSFLSVDEAHCISEWGHEFRPHYRTVGRARYQLGCPTTMALTATATPATRADIVSSLRLARPITVVQSFDRTNLFFSARKCDSEVARLRELVRLLRVHDGTAIVYVQTRNRTDAVASTLRRRGFSAAPYHAALPAAARKALLGRFLNGRITVMVATNAFGMGIDKPDVRLVVHMGVPARPESYFQEAGRAGRDGQPSRCEMLWMPGDLVLAAKMANVETAGIRRQRQSHQVAKRAGLLAMRRYVSARGCRRKVLLDYLGEKLDSCAGCDRCRTIGQAWLPIA